MMKPWISSILSHKATSTLVPDHRPLGDPRPSNLVPDHRPLGDPRPFTLVPDHRLGKFGWPRRRFTNGVLALESPVLLKLFKLLKFVYTIIATMNT